MRRCASGVTAEDATPARAVLDETYLKVHGQWCYLYRAIDRDGNLIDTMLSATRDMRAAQILPLGTVSCRLCTRPSDKRRA